MKIALCSDEPYAVNETLASELAKRGHEVIRFGSCVSNQEEPWVDVTLEAALAVHKGICKQGVFFCYSGTGSTIVANKVPGVRAALCTDAETARAARIWNDANVLVMSNRLTSEVLAKEIIAAWFEPIKDERGKMGAARLKEVDKEFRASI